MATLKKYDLTGREIGEVVIEEALLSKGANSQMIKDYLVALRTNARQWSAHTKSRAEVSHSGQKPHPQKGTGRARQGYLGAPQYKGGGRVGGPRAKVDQHIRINKKEKRAAIRHLLTEKIQNNQVIVLKCDELTQPKTKLFAAFLTHREIYSKSVLFLSDDLASSNNDFMIKSIRNIPKATVMLMLNASGYNIAATRNIVVLEPAIEQLLKILEG